MDLSTSLESLTNEHSEHTIDEKSGEEVLHIDSSHTLIQAAGYLKYELAKRDNKNVYFRGQRKIYDTLRPSLFRGIKRTNKLQDWRDKINNFIDNIHDKGNALRAVRKGCSEALLQHYGIKTTWIDVVDNIWVALWFSCHRAMTYGSPEKYLHFERREPDYYRSERPEYAYILLMASANQPSNNFPGHYKDDDTETIDLRVAAPSNFVRPHAQHGVLVRKLSINGLPVGDCSDMHVGTIRIDLPTALTWIGSAKTLDSHSLFPPAFYDYGYRELLEDINPDDKELGAIDRIQA